MDRPKEVLISLVIQTRERVDTLVHTLRSATAQVLEDFEILVSDNCSQDRTAEAVRLVQDPRVRLVQTERRLSMCDNWEFALQHARGRYVIFIGDDDAALPGGIDRLAALIQDRPSEAYMWTPPIYYWPIDKLPPSINYLPPFQKSHDLDLHAMAHFVLAHGGWKYYELPGVYHAAVARTVLDRIGAKAGRVFRTTQPDLFTSMAVPAFVPRAVHTGAPVTLHGRSAKSNGGSSTAKDGPAMLERYIREFGDYRVHPALYPKLSPYANLFMDSFLVAIDCFPDTYRAEEFNYSAMWAFLYKLKLTTKGYVWSHRSEIRSFHGLDFASFLVRALFQDAALLRRKILNGMQDLGPFRKSMPDNVCDFARILSDWKLGPAPQVGLKAPTTPKSEPSGKIP